LLEGGFCFLHYLPQGRWAFSTLKPPTWGSLSAAK